MERKLAWMKETDMAVVVSQEQNEIQTFQKWDLDIKTHRERMEKEELDKQFKDADSKLRVVFVCAMWLTGFDVKTLSCLYIDKPMKAHTMKDNLSKDDIKKLKTVAKELLEKIKALLATMDHPFDKQETKAAIIITIRDILWQELPESYSEENITEYRDAVYNYVSQHYG